VARFSSRLPRSLEPTRLSRIRDAVGTVPWDLTVSNPTRCGLPRPDDLLAGLADPGGLDYRPDPRGPLSGRTAVAGWYRRWDLDLKPDRVVLTASTSEAYSLLFKLLADPGDAVLVPTPSYPLFDQLCRLEGIEARPYQLDPEAGWRIDLESVASSGNRCRGVIVVHPNNPTGSHVHPDDAADLATFCRARHLPLIADEVFLPFVVDGGPGDDRSFAGAADVLTFALGGLSKCIGLPQLKLGWIVVGGPDGEVEAALDRLDHITDAFLSVSTPVALSAGTLLDRGAPVGAAITARCRGNLTALRKIAATWPAVTVPPVGGGWSVPIRVPAVCDDEDLAIRLLTERGIAVQPGYLFDLPHDGTLVLSLLTPDPVWREGLGELFAALDAWTG
jgi:aspartate/methionine/tyrosine aminotransferase